MDLAASRSALLRNKLVMRLGCVLVAVGFLASSVVTPRALAVAVVDDVAVGAMSCAAFLESIGLPLTATSTSTALVPVGITAVAGEYAAATGAATSGEAFLGTVAAGTAVSTAGTIILTAAAVAACAALAYWLYDTHFADDEDPIPLDSLVPIYISGGPFSVLQSGSSWNSSTWFGVDDFLVTKSGSSWHLDWDYNNLYDKNGEITLYTTTYSGLSSSQTLKINPYYMSVMYKVGSYEKDGKLVFGIKPVSGGPYLFTEISPESVLFAPEDYVESPQSLFLSVTDRYSVPEIQPNQSMEITIPSAAPGSTLADLVETVPQQVVDGTLSAIYTIDTAAPTPPSFSGEDVEDVDELGLPSLGEALTRRFPFSIPWDIARGITLLAAPAKAPYFEVDFYEVIGDRVGGWQGSTKLVLDFSEYEILGRLSRWTSTIGFCLFLASASKRFIWTA